MGMHLKLLVFDVIIDNIIYKSDFITLIGCEAVWDEVIEG